MYIYKLINDWYICRGKFNGRLFFGAGMTHEEIVELLLHYNRYIQEANNDNLYKTGWRPVCIKEFFDNEYQEIMDAN